MAADTSVSLARRQQVEQAVSGRDGVLYFNVVWVSQSSVSLLGVLL